MLIGPDHVGKTSALRALRQEPRWHIVSPDGDLLQDGYVVVSQVKRYILSHILQRGQACYSSAFVLSCIHLLIMYLHDQVSAAMRRPASVVLVDSYYYKLLAKCMLKDLVDHELFALWRALPRPDRVILLHAEPEVLWQRSGRGEHLNPFEHYGTRPDRDAFLRFQEDVIQQMLREVEPCEVDLIHARGTVTETRDQIRDALTCRALEAHQS